MGERAYNLTTVSALCGLILLGCWMNGCAGPRGGAETPPVGEAISRAQAHVQTAQSHIELVAPHTAGSDRANLDTARSALVSGSTDLDEAQRLNHAKDQQINALSADLTTAKAQLAAERDQWFGDKTHRLLSWVIGIAAGLFIGYELLGTWLGGGPLIKAVSGFGGLAAKAISSIGIKLFGRKPATGG